MTKFTCYYQLTTDLTFSKIETIKTRNDSVAIACLRSEIATGNATMIGTLVFAVRRIAIALTVSCSRRLMVTSTSSAPNDFTPLIRKPIYN